MTEDEIKVESNPIEKIKIPDVVEGTWIGSFEYKIIVALNNIIDFLNNEFQQGNSEWKHKKTV